MKQFLAYMIMTLAALWMAGCSDDSLSDDPTDQPERGIVIRLSTGDLETRTDLTSQANLQHVRKVYALLYDGTGDLVGRPELLMDVDETSQAWDPTEGGSYNDINGEEFVLPQTKTDGLTAGDYTVLCVGLDDRSGETYGLIPDNPSDPDNPNKIPSAMRNWTTLKDARATLAAEKGADDIAHSELFAGWAEFEFEPDNINIVEVEMKRRVAGILCYVTDIPTTINTDGKNKPVKKLRLALYTGEKPNNQISLCRKEVEKATNGTIKIPDDFGEYSEGAQKLDIENGYLVLKEVDLSKYNSDGDIFSIPKQDTENLKVKANSLLIGAYVIPTKATDGKKVTLKVELLGEGDKVLATFNAKRDGTSGNESYNIYPNYIYHIGDKPEPASTEGDQPASLLGKELTVVPQEWTTMPEVDVDFPSVPLMATMELVDQNNVEYNGNHIFDCIGVDDQYYTGTNKDGQLYYPYAKNEQRIKLKINPSLLKSRWKVSLIGQDESASMLYIKSGDNYVQTYTAADGEFEKETYLELLMTSYAENNDKGSRTVKIQLETYDASDNPGAFVSYLEVKQYNAIIVDMGDDGVRGFCHYDYGAEFGEAQTVIWGYHGGTINTEIGDNTLDNGNTNFTTAREHAGTDPDGSLYKAFFGGCAMYLCGRPFISVTDDKKDSSSKNWYLPARIELRNFMRNNPIEVNGKSYWTSSAYGSFRAFCNYIKSNGELQDDDDKWNNWYQSYTALRTDFLYMRQACIISD